MKHISRSSVLIMTSVAVGACFALLFVYFGGQYLDRTSTSTDSEIEKSATTAVRQTAQPSQFPERLEEGIAFKLEEDLILPVITNDELIVYTGTAEQGEATKILEEPENFNFLSVSVSPSREWLALVAKDNAFRYENSFLFLIDLTDSTILSTDVDVRSWSWNEDGTLFFVPDRTVDQSDFQGQYIFDAETEEVKKLDRDILALHATTEYIENFNNGQLLYRDEAENISYDLCADPPYFCEETAAYGFTKDGTYIYQLRDAYSYRADSVTFFSPDTEEIVEVAYDPREPILDGTKLSVVAHTLPRNSSDSVVSDYSNYLIHRPPGPGELHEYTVYNRSGSIARLQDIHAAGFVEDELYIISPEASRHWQDDVRYVVSVFDFNTSNQRTLFYLYEDEMSWGALR